MEPTTKLFPAVFVLPSSQNMVQFDLGKLKVSRKELLHLINFQNRKYSFQLSAVLCNSLSS